MKLRIEQLRHDGGTQPRVSLNFAAIESYCDDMGRGVKFPPIEVWYDGQSHWIVDGFHRCKAAFAAGLDEIDCEIHQGTLQQAQWRSFGVNQKHGLMRSVEDKQQAIRAALRHPMASGMSDSQIAKHIGCHQTWVSKIHREIDGALKSSLKSGVSNESHRLCSDGRVMNTANIGKRRTVSISEPSPSADAYIADEQYAELPIAEEPAAEEIAPVAQSEEPPICDRKVAGSTPAGGSTRHPAPPKPTPSIDRERESVELLRSIFDLAEHQVSASDVMEFVPEGNIALVYQKARAAFEFIGFVFDAAGKRQRGVA